MRQILLRHRDTARNRLDRPARASLSGSSLARANTSKRTPSIPVISLPMTRRSQSLGFAAMSCPSGRLEAGDRVACLFFLFELTAMFWASVRLKECRRHATIKSREA